MLTKELVYRFFCKVHFAPSGCWEWTDKEKIGIGYGRMRVGDRRVRAHRLAWEIRHGKDPGDALVLHRCDNPACVRVDHLFLGNHDDNMADRQFKGRTVKVPGSKHGMAKLTERDVLQIRALRSRGKLHREIAAEFNVTQGMISMILAGKNWTHV